MAIARNLAKLGRSRISLQSAERKALIGALMLASFVGCNTVVDYPTELQRNEQATLQTLAQLMPQSTGCCVTSVKADENLILLPDRPVNTSGYVLTLHIEGSSFRVDAIPAREGTTGRWSYFRTEDGTVRHSDGRPVFVKDAPVR